MAADDAGSFYPTARQVISPEVQPFFDVQVTRERARIAEHLAHAKQSSGVCWSAMGCDPLQPMTVENLLAAAERDMERANSPRGRFLAALDGVRKLPTHEADAERLRALYSRDLADDRYPANPKAIGAALTILVAIPGKDARACVEALAEMLMARAA